VDEIDAAMSTPLAPLPDDWSLYEIHVQRIAHRSARRAYVLLAQNDDDAMRRLHQMIDLREFRLIRRRRVIGGVMQTR